MTIRWRALLVLTLGGCSDRDEPRAPSARSTADEATLSTGSAAAPTPSPTAPAEAPSVPTVSVLADGIRVRARGECPQAGADGRIPVMRDGAHDFAALTACARHLKARSPDEVAVVVAAAPSTRYEDLVSALDALRSDAEGELFPSFSLGMSAGAITSSSSVATPGASMPSHSAAAEEGSTVVMLSKTSIIVGNDVIASYTLDEVRDRGLPSRYKGGSESELYVTPLGEALAGHRKVDAQRQAAKGIDPATSELVVVADADLPYRVLFEVLYTAGRHEYGKYHLLTRKRGD